MISPKKWQQVLEETSEELGVPLPFMKALIVAYWEQIRKEVVEMNVERIQISGLGNFDLKFWKLKYEIARYRSFINYHEKSGNERAVAIICNLKLKLERCEKALEIETRVMNKRIEKRNERREFIQKKHGGLEKSQKDSSGNSLHTVSKPICGESSENPLGGLSS